MPVILFDPSQSACVIYRTLFEMFQKHVSDVVIGNGVGVDARKPT